MLFVFIIILTMLYLFSRGLETLVRYRFFLILFFYLACLFVSDSVFASENMVIDRFYDIIPSSTAFLNKTITNNSDQTLYLKVSISRARNVFSKEQDKPLSPEQMAHSLLILNQAIIIPPKETRLAKFYLPESHSKSLRFYRVNFTPVAPTVANGFNLHLSSPDLIKIKAATSFSVGISTLVTVSPQGKENNLVSVVNNHGQLEISNVGNSPAVLTLSGYKLDKARKSSSKEKIARHSFSGMSLILPAHKISVSIKDFSGKARLSVSFNPSSKKSSVYYLKG